MRPFQVVSSPFDINLSFTGEEQEMQSKMMFHQFAYFWKYGLLGPSPRATNSESLGWNSSICFEQVPPGTTYSGASLEDSILRISP